MEKVLCIVVRGVSERNGASRKNRQQGY